jgi:UPF0755 protein
MPQKNESRSIKKIIFSIILLVIIGIGAYSFSQYRNYSRSLSEPNSDSTETVSFEVPQGATSDQIADSLIENGLLKSEYREYFILYLKRSGEGSKIQAGSFSIPKNLSIEEISITLQKAGVSDVWVTIPEGIRKDEIADILASTYSGNSESIYDRTTFLQLTEDPTFISSLQLEIPVSNLEGFIFPDKYLFHVDASSEEILRIMVNNFKSKISGYNYEDVIIASMLEREGRNSTERSMISDIIRRRDNEGWFLNIDATLLYYYKDWNHVLTFEDTGTDHPYNTYTRLGLPPTPISNPGEATIKASINPTSNEYYYYLHDNNGKIYYGRTNEEHIQNINNYLNY